jgi:hypothetical protein
VCVCVCVYVCVCVCKWLWTCHTCLPLLYVIAPVDACYAPVGTLSCLGWMDFRAEAYVQRLLLSCLNLMDFRAEAYVQRLLLSCLGLIDFQALAYKSLQVPSLLSFSEPFLAQRDVWPLPSSTRCMSFPRRCSQFLYERWHWHLPDRHFFGVPVELACQRLQWSRIGHSRRQSRCARELCVHAISVYVCEEGNRGARENCVCLLCVQKCVCQKPVT